MNFHFSSNERRQVLCNYRGKGQREGGEGEEEREKSYRQMYRTGWNRKERERKCRKHGSREKAGQVECEPTIRTFVIGKRGRERRKNGGQLAVTFAQPAPVTYRVREKEREHKAHKTWQFKCEKEPLKMKESFVRLKEKRREREKGNWRKNEWIIAGVTNAIALNISCDQINTTVVPLFLSLFHEQIYS